ncbi:MAG: hypothetical protein ACI9P5_004620 [Saprospiraceae bacterium]|jgi:hypothetical protein
MITPGKNGLYHPRDEKDISALIKYAIKNNLKVRVRGAAQSVLPAISVDQAMTIQLDQIRHISFEDNYQVKVGAGCNLANDPFDPSCTSNKLNGLYRLINKKGWALPNVPDAAHQTVGGFISTGSSGATLSHSFDDTILSIKLVDGQGDIQEFKKTDNPDDTFFGIGSSVGLMGVIYEVTLQCIPAFNIIGSEVTTNAEDAPFDLFGVSGSDKPGLIDYFSNQEYARTLWWPFQTLHRTINWKARKMSLSDYNDQTTGSNLFEPKPYVPVFPKILTDRYSSELLSATIFGLVTSWPSWLYAFLDANKINIPKEKLEGIVALIDAMAPGLYPLLTDFYYPVNTDKNPAQQFWDYWLGSLPMDTFEFSNPLMNLDYTELWFPIEKAELAIKVLKKDFDKQGEKATGFYTLEILGSMASPFWLSPGYNQKSIRLNFMRFATDAGSPIDFYYQYYQLFKKYKIPFRLHLGKYLPGKEIPMWAKYIRESYPKMGDFEELRKKMDPHNLFLTPYWKDYLLLS